MCGRQSNVCVCVRVWVRDWKTGDEVAADDFSFKNPTQAKKIDLKDIAEKTDEFPKNFEMGGAK